MIPGSLQFVSRMMGVLWNKLVFHVDADNLDNLYQCYIVELVGLLVLIPFVRLIPTWAEVEQVQANIADLNLDAKTPMTVTK